jgi:O-antigen/teichoic acid export membrane protein
MLGTASVAHYSVALQIAQLVPSMLSRTVAFLFPLTSATAERGDVNGLRRMYYRSLRFVSILAAGALLPVFLFSADLLSFWMGTDFSSRTSPVLQLLCLHAVVLSTSIVPHYVMNGSGHVKPNTLFGSVSGLVNIGGMSLLVPVLGLSGAGWGRLLSLPVSAVSRVFVHRNILGEEVRASVALRLFVPVGLVFLAAWVVRRSTLPDGLSVATVLILALATALLGAFAMAGLGSRFGAFRSVARDGTEQTR